MTACQHSDVEKGALCQSIPSALSERMYSHSGDQFTFVLLTCAVLVLSRLQDAAKGYFRHPAGSRIISLLSLHLRIT